MRLPTMQGIIKRRLLVNFRADPAVVQRLLPTPFRPKLHNGHSIVGICLIRLERIRPAGFPGFLGLSSENAAHRIAVEWSDSDGKQREGVFIPRRDTGSLLNQIGGGRIFPGEHHGAHFSVADNGKQVNLTMESNDKSVSVLVAGQDADAIPSSSCFGSIEETSKFFEGGSLGYSVTRKGDRFDGLLLSTTEWRIHALNVTEVKSSYFEDRNNFPNGSVEFDHALIMRDIPHQWHASEDLHSKA